MRIGYACITLGVPGTELHGTVLKNAVEDRLYELVGQNLLALDKALSYNASMGIRLFRISSDIIPFGSHPQVRYAWDRRFASTLAALGEKARAWDMRLSMHPGQYTVLNSPSEDVVARAVLDLEYHNRFLDRLGLPPSHKIILHVGGAYGDKAAALARFRKNLRRLSPGMRSRLVLENDDRIFAIDQVLKLGQEVGLPVVFDNLHHQVLPPVKQAPEGEWIRACAATWGPEDGPPKLHYAEQDPGKKPGAHARSIRAERFVAFAGGLGEPVDVMLEVKDKNLSAVKAVLCTREQGPVRLLEAEWARYKYLVLEHAPAAYQAIRILLKDKSAYPVMEFYRLIETALDQAPTPGTARNAASHVWGYFRKNATAAEKQRFEALLEAVGLGSGQMLPVKRMLLRLAKKYQEAYLLDSYYFWGT